MKKTIREQYGLQVYDLFKAGRYEAFRTQNSVCCIVPVSSFEDEELYELYYMSQFLQEKGDPHVAAFLLTKDNGLYFEEKSVRYSICRSNLSQKRAASSPGRELARFHQKARAFPYSITKVNRIGQWKHLWEKRLDQLEGFWRGKVQAHPLDPFEKLFIESFPYYLGLAENAIQYLVDTELDDHPQPIDAATISHNRFSAGLWQGEHPMKMPTDWIFDHCSRDIAEHLRHEFHHRQAEMREEGFRFLEEYDRTTPLSSFSWRLLYSRLLFPLHYFECIEEYYLSNEAGKKEAETRLKKMLKDSNKYEEFLSAYSSMLSIRTRKINLPAISWL